MNTSSGMNNIDDISLVRAIYLKRYISNMSIHIDNITHIDKLTQEKKNITNIAYASPLMRKKKGVSTLSPFII